MTQNIKYFHFLLFFFFVFILLLLLSFSIFFLLLLINFLLFFLLLLLFNFPLIFLLVWIYEQKLKSNVFVSFLSFCNFILSHVLYGLFERNTTNIEKKKSKPTKSSFKWTFYCIIDFFFCLKGRMIYTYFF